MDIWIIVLLVLSVAFAVASGIPRGKSNAIQFHFSTSKWKDKPEVNPLNSWKQKWKNGEPKQGERFWLSSTLLVGFTDHWHRWEGRHRMLLSLGFLTFGIAVAKLSWWLLFGIIPLYLIFTLSFHIFYNHYKNN